MNTAAYERRANGGGRFDREARNGSTKLANKFTRRKVE
jgi:hypothetical protein